MRGDGSDGKDKWGDHRPKRDPCRCRRADDVLDGVWGERDGGGGLHCRSFDRGVSKSSRSSEVLLSVVPYSVGVYSLYQHAKYRKVIASRRAGQA